MGRADADVKGFKKNGIHTIRKPKVSYMGNKICFYSSTYSKILQNIDNVSLCAISLYYTRFILMYDIGHYIVLYITSIVVDCGDVKEGDADCLVP